MRICLLMLGKTRRPELRAVFEDYVKRIKYSLGDRGFGGAYPRGGPETAGRGSGSDGRVARCGGQDFDFRGFCKMAKCACATAVCAN